MKKYKHPAGYTIEYDENKFTKSPNGTLFPNVIPELKPENIEKKRLKEEAEKVKKEEARIKELKKLVSKRALVKHGYNETIELIFLELSPSGYYAKVMTIHGMKDWRELKNIHVKEVLGDYPKYAKAKAKKAK